MSIVSDLLKDSMRLIGAIATGETPSAAEQSDGLRSLNRMISAWNAEGLLIFKKTRETFPLVANQAAYTFGPTGNFNSIRPMKIEIVKMLVGGVEVPVSILNTQEWASIALKNTTSTYPTRVYFEGTYPLETMNVWPIPTDVNSIVIYSDKPITSFATVGDTISFPEGYEDAMVHNLAVRLAPEYGKSPDPVIIAIADKSKAAIKRKNVKPVYAKVDASRLAGHGRSFNILTGE